MKQSRILILCIFLSVISCTVGTARGSDHHSVSFSVVGDIMQHDLQIETAYNPSCKCYEYKPVFEPVKEYLEKADITIGNLETTLPGDPKKYSGYPEFGAPDSLVTALDYVGFDILTTANNHSLDKGKSGLKRTIKVLDQKGIVHLGTYSSHTEHKKNRVLFVHKNGIKFALLNYTYGTNGIAVPKDVVVNLIDDKKIMEDMALAREAKPDVIVVLYHFGGEYLRQPDEYQKKYVNLAFNEGADIVLGGHPHVLQPFEVKNVKDKFGKQKNRLVIYSLGNFVSNQQRRYTDGGMIFNFTVRKKGETISIDSIHYIPVWVYVEKKPKKTQFYVLPIEDFIENPGSPSLTASSMQRMKLFYKDTTQHLHESLEKTAFYRKDQ